MIRVLSLFSGVGMIDLGLQWSGMEIVGQVEIEPYCRAVLDKHWPGLWRREDVTAVSDDDVRALAPDLIAGGFPCQDVSVAGKGKGVEHGERSGLWREFARLVRAARPRWVLAENVPGLRNRGADIVLSDLEQAGYSCWPVVVGAEHVGAPHKRHRVWIVAYAASGGQRADGRARRGGGHADERGAGVDDTQGKRLGVERINNGAPARDEYALGDAGEACPESAMAHPSSTGRGAGTGADRGAAGAGRRGEEPGTSGGGGLWTLADSDDAALAAELVPGGSAHQAAVVAGSGGGRLAYADGARGAAGLSRANEPGREGIAEVTDDLRRGFHWPMPPGPEQHPWEAPRLTQPGMGNATDGAAKRLAGFARRNALKALGNGAVPQVVAEIGSVIVQLDGDSK